MAKKIAALQVRLHAQIGPATETRASFLLCRMTFRIIRTSYQCPHISEGGKRGKPICMNLSPVGILCLRPLFAPSKNSVSIFASSHLPTHSEHGIVCVQEDLDQRRLQGDDVGRQLADVTDLWRRTAAEHDALKNRVRRMEKEASEWQAKAVGALQRCEGLQKRNDSLQRYSRARA